LRARELRELLQVERPVLRRADRAVARAADVDDLRKAAARRWPQGVRDYVEGGADGEVSLRRNRAAFQRYELVPKVLRDVSAVDTSSVVLGSPATMPLALGPTGYTRMMHPDGETAVARAAARAGVPYTIATMSTVALEELPTDGEQWFQLYMWRDRSLVEELLARAGAHGCGALMLTVDTAVTGHRLRDTRNGFALPPRLTPRTLVGMARRPGWCAAMLRGEPITFANVPPELASRSESVMEFAARQFDSSVSWKDLEWLRERWPGVLAVKGILDPTDAARAVEHGADAVVVSNHGGRQLDQTVPPLDVLPAVRDRIGDTAAVLVDSGLRRGSDLAIALALGADAGLLGRAYLYGLGAAGEAGVSRVLDIIATELAKAMRLLGVVSVEELRKEGTSLVRGRRTELSQGDAR
jgi:L-lactate dehydrogenase (cytochrome)